ncbi:F-box-like domain-containing protein, partial [Microcystis sp. M63BS1]
MQTDPIWEFLPNELWVHIFDYLSDFYDIYRAVP